MMRTRAKDPVGRRNAIVEAAVAVIAEVGVHKVTHRRIANRARVPLGSLTYYFARLDDILEAAFRSYVDTMVQAYNELLLTAASPDEAIDALVQFLHLAAGSPTRTRLLFELYSHAQHDDATAVLVQDWMASTQVCLLKHFAPETAAAVDALVEGLLIRQTLQTQPIADATVRASLAALTTVPPRHG